MIVWIPNNRSFRPKTVRVCYEEFIRENKLTAFDRTNNSYSTAKFRSRGIFFGLRTASNVAVEYELFVQSKAVNLFSRINSS